MLQLNDVAVERLNDVLAFSRQLSVFFHFSYYFQHVHATKIIYKPVNQYWYLTFDGYFYIQLLCTLKEIYCPSVHNTPSPDVP